MSYVELYLNCMAKLLQKNISQDPASRPKKGVELVVHIYCAFSVIWTIQIEKRRKKDGNRPSSRGSFYLDDDVDLNGAEKDTIFPWEWKGKCHQKFLQNTKRGERDRAATQTDRQTTCNDKCLSLIYRAQMIPLGSGRFSSVLVLFLYFTNKSRCLWIISSLPVQLYAWVKMVGWALWAVNGRWC